MEILFSVERSERRRAWTIDNVPTSSGGRTGSVAGRLLTWKKPSEVSPERYRFADERTASGVVGGWSKNVPVDSIVRVLPFGILISVVEYSRRAAHNPHADKNYGSTTIREPLQLVKGRTLLTKITFFFTTNNDLEKSVLSMTKNV